MDLPTDGPIAPPRLNGELVFEAPWQSRCFGLAAALAEGGRLQWNDFQTALIRQVESADQASNDTGDPSNYWACWLAALAESAPAEVNESAWSDRCLDLAARPAGHDH